MKFCILIHSKLPPDLNRPLLFIPLEFQVSRYNRRTLSELCSIFKVDRYLKLAGAIFDSTCVFYGNIIQIYVAVGTSFQTRLEGGRGIISQIFLVGNNSNAYDIVARMNLEFGFSLQIHTLTALR
jgi:hypothetical protein